jgi:hypothetical protein
MPITIASLTNSQLLRLRLVHDRSGGPRTLFRDFYGRAPQTTEEVEDLAIKFYTEFNKRFGTTY